MPAAPIHSLSTKPCHLRPLPVAIRVRTAQENFDLSTFGRSINVFAPPRRFYGIRLAYEF